MTNFHVLYYISITSRLYLELLPPVALRAVPLHDGLAQIQQENISIVKAVPRHLHLQTHTEVTLNQTHWSIYVKYLQHHPWQLWHKRDNIGLIGSGRVLLLALAGAVLGLWPLHIANPWPGPFKAQPSIPRWRWRFSSLWRAAAAGRCRSLCRRGQNPRLSRPSCSWRRNKKEKQQPKVKCSKSAAWVLGEARQKQNVFNYTRMTLIWKHNNKS